MMKFNFENLLKISLPIIIVLGIVDLTAYYYQFNTPIIEYLELSEIPTLFLRNITTILFGIIPIFALATADKLNKRAYLALLIIIAILFGVISLLNDNLHFPTYKLFYLLIISLIFIPVLIAKEFKNITLKKDDTLWIFTTYIFIALLAIVSIKGYLNSRDVKQAHIFSGTKVVINDSILISNDSFYYIGKTNNYIFFYDEKTKNSVIYPLEKVNKITLKNKRLQENGGDRPPKPPGIP